MASGMLRALLAVLAVIYPLLVYAGISHLGASTYGLLLAIIVILRLQGLSHDDRKQLMLPTTIAFTYAVVVALMNDETLLRLYPALINAMMLMAFGRSLLEPPSLIERFLAARGTAISAAGRVYVRNVTAAWCVFFASNGCIAVYTALFTSLDTWALYNGFLAYIIMGLLFCVELVVRHFYRLRHPEQQGADG